MARVIIDAEPLIAFVKVNQTDLFQHLFGNIYITTSVQQECMAKPCTESMALCALMQAEWLHICDPTTGDQPLSLSLGDGERDSIHLASEDPSGSLLVIDDYLARKQAIRLDLPVIGTVRILDIAEKRGLINSAEAVISDMKNCGYRISLAILERMRNA